MESIGVSTQRPSQNKSGKWDYIDVFFENSEEFNLATAKMMNVLYKTNAEGRCLVTDEKGSKYVLDVVHSTYDTKNNIIRLFPYSCHQVNLDKTNKEKTNKK